MSNGNNLNRSEPVIDFTSADAESIGEDMVVFAKANYPDTWTDFNDGQLAIVNKEQVEYVFDTTMFYLNALINECFTPTAIRRQSLIDRGLSLDYVVPSAVAATVTERLTVDPAGPFPFTILASSHRVSNGGSDDEVIFMPVADVVVPSAPGGGFVDVLFIEGDLISESLGSSSGLADQRILLQQKPLIDGTLIVRVAGVPWTRVDHAVDMAMSDEEYRVETDEQSNTFVIFGDGVNGKIPPLAAALTATYKIGGGKRGNLTSGTITTPVSVPSQITAVTNPTASTGGADTPTNRIIRRNIPASLRVKNGAITKEDIADAALLTPGVAKAYSSPGDPVTRSINLYIAPDGGGVASDVLKNQVLIDLAEKKMVGQRIAIQDPVYKNLRITILAHVKKGFRQSEVQEQVESIFSTVDEAGVYDFPQVNFSGLDGNGDPEAGVEAIMDLLSEDSLGNIGIRRIEIQQLDVVPESRVLRPITGDGSVTGISTPTNDHVRREWVIRFTSGTTFVVKERIVGTVKQVQDSSIIDDTQNFDFDLPGNGFTVLNPDRRSSLLFTVLSNSLTQVSTTAGGVFLAAEPGASYYIERSLAASGTVGVPYTALDKDGQGVLQFTIVAGSTPFSTADEIIIDTFPPIGDIILRPDEILQLLASNLSVRLAGGITS